MKFQIKKADRSDLISLLSFMNDDSVIDRRMSDRFDAVLCQTNHSVLFAIADGEIVGTLSMSVIDGLGSDFPFAVVGGGKIKPEFSGRGVDRALLSHARYIAASMGCRELR